MNIFLADHLLKLVAFFKNINTKILHDLAIMYNILYYDEEPIY